jgi:hypothetical protein
MVYLMVTAILLGGGAAWFTSEVLTNSYFGETGWLVILVVWVVVIAFVWALIVIRYMGRQTDSFIDKLLSNWR